MRVREITEAIEKWGSASHHLTLVLIAAAVTSGVAAYTYPVVSLATVWIGHALHGLHYLAFLLAVLNGATILFFRRNIGQQIALALRSHYSIHPDPVSIIAKEARYRYQAMRVAPDDVEFVTDPESWCAKSLFEMNVHSFEGSAFEMSEEEIVDRDTALIAQNGKTFLLVRNPLRETREDADFIGFSSVLPLNRTGSDLYLSGLIKDRHIRSSMLCSEGEPCDTILVFAIALKPEYRKVKGLAAAYYPFLLRCAEHHIRTVAAAHPGCAKVTAWVQAEHPKLRQHLGERGFVFSPGKRSADGFDLYSRDIEVIQPMSGINKSIDTNRTVV